jgi:glycosyltransferase involved in cell wall biosynthesis
VANYSLRKNQGMALEAFIKAHIPGSSLVFIGSHLGDYGRELQNRWSKVQSRYPEISVYFLENFSRPEVVSAFKCCDVLLLSATAETQPIVILEAMACSKPFISTDTGCVSELQGGIVVSDVSDMALHMRRLAENVSERDALGQLARKYFETHHAPEVTNRAWLDLIYEITDETAVSKTTDLP